MGISKVAYYITGTLNFLMIAYIISTFFWVDPILKTSFNPTIGTIITVLIAIIVLIISSMYIFDKREMNKFSDVGIILGLISLISYPIFLKGALIVGEIAGNEPIDLTVLLFVILGFIALLGIFSYFVLMIISFFKDNK